MGIKHEIRRFLWKLGYDISRFAPASHPLARRKQIFQSYSIDTVLDVGANSGQFAMELRNDIGYTNRILSFEPLSAAFESLERKARPDQAWETFNFALGDAEERREINIAGNSVSSSMLDMLPTHQQSAPDSKYIGKETIQINTLDSIYGRLSVTGKSIYMKIDTQGFEGKVLRGAEKSLSNIDTIQIEMSLVPLYKDEPLFNEMCLLMSQKGYTLISIENGFADPASGQLLQLDGIFHRMESLAPSSAAS